MNTRKKNLTTKFIYPEFDDKVFLIRKNLDHKLKEINNSKITYISAPSGFGKTTLIAQWLIENKENIFISLDDFDNDLLCFLSSVIDAFNYVFSFKLEHINNIDINEIEKVLLSIIEISHKKDIFIILDNFSCIKNSKIYDLLLLFIKISPKNFHFIILSENEIPIIFAEIIIQKKTVFINSQDLLIDKDEIILFFEKNKITLEEKYIDIIYEKTEGWILAVKTILLSLNDYKNKTDFFETAINITNKYLTDFITKNIFEKIEVETLDFLMKTSVLKRFNFSICNKLLEITNSQDFIEKIQYNNLFVIALDSNKNYYKYNNIFSDSLLEILNKKDESLVNLLYKKASNIFKENGNYIESLDYAFITKDYIFIADNLEEQAHLFFRDYNYFHLDKLIKKIPSDIVFSKIKLSLYHSLILLTNFETEFSEMIFESSENLYNKNNTEDKEIQSIIYLINSILSLRKNNKNSEILKYANLSLNNLNNLNYDLIGFASYCLSKSFLHLLDLKKSIKIIDKCILYNDNKNIFMDISHKSYKAAVLIIIGDFFEAETILINLLEYMNKNHLDNNKIKIVIVFYLCVIYYKFNNIDLFNKFSDIGLEIIKNNHDLSTENLIAFYSNLIYSNFTLGNIEKSENYTKIVKKLNLNKDFLEIDSKIKIIEIRKNIYSNNLNKIDINYIKELISSFNINYSENNKTYNKISKLRREGIVLAEYYIAKNLFRDANNILELLININLEFPRYISEIYILKAILYKKQNNKQKSIYFMKEALIEAENNNYIRPFVEEKKKIDSIIIEIIKELEEKKIDISKTFVYNVFCNMNSNIVIKNKKLSLEKIINPLSKRETQIMIYLDKELSNTEIALNLKISENTIKVHLNNIFKKFNVKNRKDAIEKYKESQIIK